MFLSILSNVFLAQAVVCFIVVVCLKKILDNQLLDLAFRQIDYWKLQESSPSVTRHVLLTTHRKIKPKIQEKFRNMTAKRLGPGATIAFSVDKRLMGGAVITIDSKVYDFSLRDRLKQAVHYR